MFLARVHCSDCPEELEIVVEELDELWGLACDCGFGLVLESVSEVELLSAPNAPVFHLPRVTRLRRAA